MLLLLVEIAGMPDISIYSRKSRKYQWSQNAKFLTALFRLDFKPLLKLLGLLQSKQQWLLLQ